MQRDFFSLLAATFCLLALCIATGCLSNAQADGPETDGFVALFNGKTLSGWTLADGKPIAKGWIVEDGTLCRADRGGDIYTDKEYANFILEMEWKISEKGNSGIKYRITQYGKALLGPEYQILDDENHPDGKRGTNRQTAALYDILSCNDQKQLKPLGEFNKTRIVVNGTKAEHWLNGKKVVEYDTTSDAFAQAVEKSKFRSVEGFATKAAGRIMLQDHGDKVWYRDIRIKVLD